MKIAFVLTEYDKNIGIGRGAVELAERFARQHEVHVFAISGNHTSQSNIIFHQVPICRSTALLKMLTFFVASGILLRRYKFDIIHLRRFSAFPCNIVSCHSVPMAGMNVLRQLNREYHLDFSWRETVRYRLLGPMFKYNYRRGAHKKVIAVSHSVKREIEQFYGTPEDDIVVIPNGVDLAEFTPDNKKVYRGEIRARYKISATDFVFLFIGNFFKRKGLRFVLEAFSKIAKKNFKLLIVGHDNINLSRFMRLVNDLRIGENVIFTGGTSLINQFYAAGDAFVFPSVYEPFGLVIIEAMASGLPVITAQSVGAAEIIENGVNGILVEKSYDVETLAQKMLEIEKNSALRNTITINARQTAQKYSWDLIAQRTLELYQ